MKKITTTVSLGTIEQLPTVGDNIFQVRLPLFEDNTGNKMIFDAKACVDPCFAGGYKVGDAVFVTFENEDAEDAVILGKLYIAEGELQRGAVINESQQGGTNIVVDDLIVKNQATLPANTTLGDLLANTVMMYENKLNYLEKRIEELEKKVGS